MRYLVSLIVVFNILFLIKFISHGFCIRPLNRYSVQSGKVTVLRNELNPKYNREEG